MLVRLNVQNFALIDNLEIELHPGFNVLTGETGAGKSIIIDAVGIAIGDQGLGELIRSGEDKALVEAVFEVEKNKRVEDILNEYGFTAEPGESLILSRELVKTGKNICRVNGRQVNLSVFKDIARNIVDIYGQHHQQSLLEPQKHIELLDEYGGHELISLRQKLSAVFDSMVSLQDKINTLTASEKEQARLIDMYGFQVAEIDKSRLTPGEDTTLEEEKKILANAEKLYILASKAYELLYEDSSQKPVVDLLSEALNAYKEILSIDQTAQPVYEILETSLYQMEEAARNIKLYTEKIEADPNRLEDIETRLNLIRQLKKKYGDSIQEILDYRDKTSDKLITAAGLGQELAHVRAGLNKTKAEYERLAEELSRIRKKAADILKTEITKELKELNMPHVTFEIEILPGSLPTSQGTDDIEFLISPNIGEPLKPLAKIVSGGEVSRIMLAFKTILAKIDSISTLIFDEVDAGIGGNALYAVAQKLSKAGRDRQVICVTHAPQIAGWADHHYWILKIVDKDRTVTRVKELTGPDRVEEIARMLSGGQITPLSRKHAAEMLGQSHK